MATSRSLPNVVTLADPRPGTVVGVAPGSRLRLRLDRKSTRLNSSH